MLARLLVDFAFLTALTQGAKAAVIPPTGSLALEGLADLPGPGSLSLPGSAQFFAVP